VNEATFGSLILDLQDRFTHEWEVNGEPQRALAPGAPKTFQEFLDLLDQWSQGTMGTPFANHSVHTIRKLFRRFLKIMLEGGNGVLRRDDHKGNPLIVMARDTRDPVVVDLNGLVRVPSLQRFVVAAILKQLEEERTGSHAQQGLIYLVTLDELNRFAPHGSTDAITQLIERVAAEMRSQGIILLGAQQNASLVSSRVIENAGLRVLGKSGSLELGHPVWRFLSDSARSKALNLLPEEKLLIQDSFREPMLVKIPMPPWALRKQEATETPLRELAAASSSTNGPAAGAGKSAVFDEFGEP